MGHNFTTAHSGNEALAVIIEHRVTAGSLQTIKFFHLLQQAKELCLSRYARRRTRVELSLFDSFERHRDVYPTYLVAAKRT